MDIGYREEAGAISLLLIKKYHILLAHWISVCKTKIMI